MSVEVPQASRTLRHTSGRSTGHPVLVDIGTDRCPRTGSAAFAAVARSCPDSRPWVDAVPAAPATEWLAAAADRLRRHLLHGVGDEDRLPSSVHAFGWRAAVVAAAARLEVPVVAHLEDGVPRAMGERTPDCDERLAWAAARSADVVVLDSAWALERATAHGLRRSRIVRDLPVTGVVEAAPPWTPRPAGERATVVAVGGIGVAAGTPLLVEALAGLDVRLVIASPPGAPPDSTARARDWVRQLARSLRTEGPEPTVEPFSTDLLGASDLVVDAGTETSSARGVVSAMACRRAVLAADSGPRPEIVVAGATGELLGARDRTAWRAAVVRLLQDPFKLEAYGEAGLERCAAGFSPQRRAELVHRLDQELTASLPRVA